MIVERPTMLSTYRRLSRGHQDANHPVLTSMPKPCVLTGLRPETRERNNNDRKADETTR
jgi:hypothetical protein